MSETMTNVSPIIALEDKFTPGCYVKRPIAIVRGAGAILWDDQDRRYIDCVGGIGTANIGHANAAVAQAVSEQVGRLIVCPEIFYNDRRAKLLEKLDAITPPSVHRFYLCNSGAEAVEAAIKFARLATGRPEIIATMRCFHGRTMGALSATWSEKYRDPFKPLVPEFTHVPYNRLEPMDEAISERTAAVIVEIIQGEGGINQGTKKYFTGLRNLCDERGALLIFDEVQTGFGRTGKMFACEHHQVWPDLLCAAKSIAGGIPLGFTAFGDRVGPIPKAVHGTTFGGNALVCAAGLAALEVIEQEDLPRQAAEKGAYMLKKLRALDLPAVRAVRGAGLMIGIELRKKATPYVMACLEKGVLLLPAGTTVLRLLPPLVIEYGELDETATILDEVLRTDG